MIFTEMIVGTSNPSLCTVMKRCLSYCDEIELYYIVWGCISYYRANISVVIAPEEPSTLARISSAVLWRLDW